jgi:predicted small lipoprotein YifL
MSMGKSIILLALVGSLAVLTTGCGQEGPFGNTPPQGRPDWMKKDASPAPANEPQKQ